MIKTGYKVYAKFVKKTSTGGTMFSAGLKDKAGNPHYFTVFANTADEIYDGAKVILDEITGFDISEYKGKPQFSIYAKASLDNGEVKKKVEQVKQQTVVANEDDLLPDPNIDADDLPF